LEDAIVAITKYLVTKRLAGDTITILSIKEYLIDGLSPSTIGHKYKISKFRVRGYVQRIIDKARSHYIAASIVKIVFPYVISVDPAVLKIGNRYVCLLCDTPLRAEQVEQHIRRKHRDVINELTNYIVSKIRRERSK